MVEPDAGPGDCSVDGCPNEAAKGGYCWGHLKRGQRGSTVSTPLAVRPTSPWERLLEAALTYADVESDGEFERARDNLRHAAMSYARRGLSGLVLEGLRRAREAGRRIGRPPKVDPATARALVEKGASIREAAGMLGVSPGCVCQALKRGVQKPQGF
jgi:hypothetical protein